MSETRTPNDESREERIRERAKQLWMQAGNPPGRDEEFWHKAEAEIKAEDQGRATSGPKPAADAD